MEYLKYIESGKLDEHIQLNNPCGPALSLQQGDGEEEEYILVFLLSKRVGILPQITFTYISISIHPSLVLMSLSPCELKSWFKTLLF